MRGRRAGSATRSVGKLSESEAQLGGSSVEGCSFIPFCPLLDGQK
jgi:hypothetical protein